MLDPNGEYAKAFADQGQAAFVSCSSRSCGERPLDVPAWLWSGHEWTAVAHAQPGRAAPLLMQGLRELKSGQMEAYPREAMIRRYLVSYSTRISAMLNTGTLAFAGSARPRFECALCWKPSRPDCVQFAEGADEPTRTELTTIATTTTTVVDRRRSGAYFNDFAITDLESVRDALNTLAQTLPDMGSAAPISEDAPLFFNVAIRN